MRCTRLATFVKSAATRRALAAAFVRARVCTPHHEPLKIEAAARVRRRRRRHHHHHKNHSVRLLKFYAAIMRP